MAGSSDMLAEGGHQRAFARHLAAKIHLLNAGHFALESELNTIADSVHGLLGRVH